MKKHSKKLISKGWMRLHIILSLITLPLSLIYFLVLTEAGIVDGYPAVNENDLYFLPFAISFYVFLLYWIVVGLTVWIKKGFKE